MAEDKEGGAQKRESWSAGSLDLVALSDWSPIKRQRTDKDGEKPNNPNAMSATGQDTGIYLGHIDTEFKERLKAHERIRLKLPTKPMNCGLILKHCRNRMEKLLEEIPRTQLNCKFGITSDPINRWDGPNGYKHDRFSFMIVAMVSSSLPMIEMIEAAMIALYPKGPELPGCLNDALGGEGGLGRGGRSHVTPPYYFYIVATHYDNPGAYMPQPKYG